MLSTFSILGDSGSLGKRPFYSVRLAVSAARDLATELERWAQTDRGGATLTITSDNPNRMRIKPDHLPEYEAAAQGSYVRGDSFRITGKNSCNISFTRGGAGSLANALRIALQKSSRYVLVRIASSAHDLIEFIPDAELGSRPIDEVLAAAGAELAGAVWAGEDFSDWEVARG